MSNQLQSKEANLQYFDLPPCLLRTVLGWHFSAIGNHNVNIGLVVIRRARGLFYLADDIHTLDNVAKDDMFAVQVRRRLACNEKLTAVRSRAGCCRKQERRELQTLYGMTQQNSPDRSV